MTGSEEQLQLIVPQTCKPAYRPEDCVGRGRSSKAFHMEPKYDGFRMLANVEEQVTIYSRTHKTQEGKLPWIEEELRDLLPPGTVVDGEMVAFARNEDGTIRNNFDFVQGVLNSLPERARSLQEDLYPLKYYIFDLLWQEGSSVVSLPLAERRKRLYAYFKARGKSPESLVRLVPVFACTQEEHDRLVALGYEGSVIKDRAKPYVPGKRGHGWFKIKRQPTIEAIITGFDPGVGKFKDLFGAVRFGQYQTLRTGHKDGRVTEKTTLVERGACSGMDDATRAWMHEHQEALIGKVIEVSHFGLMPGGVRFRHPQFVRMRDDKRPEDVTWHDE